MAYEDLKREIRSQIYENISGKISGVIMQQVLLDIVNNIPEELVDAGITVSPEPPEDTRRLWLDTSINEADPTVRDTVDSLSRAVVELRHQVDILMTMRHTGIVPGPVTNSTRQIMMNAADPVEPGSVPNEEEDPDVTSVKPNYPQYNEPTVPALAVKYGTWSQLDGNKLNFLPYELLWCTDRNKLYIYSNGKLIAISGSGSSEDMDEQTVNALIDAKLAKVERLDFIQVGDEEPNYTVRVRNGKLVCYSKALETRQEEPSDNYYYSSTVSQEGIVINSFYLGGKTNDSHSYQPCSHNFVELANVKMNDAAETEDISLNGFYLLYLGSDNVWHKLALWGTIPAGGTFLIRGAQCSVMDANTTVLKVKDYDMEWKDADGSLVAFDQVSAVFYLCWATPDGKFYNLGSTDPVTTLSTTNNLINVSEGTCAKGFIDLASYNNSTICEKSSYVLPQGRVASEVIFRRWYMMDPVTQSNPDDGVSAHNNKKYLTATYMDASEISENCKIEEFTPQASYQGKTLAATRSKFEENRPSVLTCTFGCQATDNTASGGPGATRGFCWTSVGYYNESIAYRRKVQSGTPNEWTYMESIKPGVTYNSDSYPNAAPCIYDQNLVSYFARIRWETSYGQSVTTHKVLIANLTAGTYEYKVVRENSDYASDVREFTVRTDADVNAGFKFIQVTDQQGASWEEYEVWNLSAKFIKKESLKTNGTVPSDFEFTINTGDICYNGSRSNEWIDYFRGYAPLCDREEMLTVGNNDLAPITMRDIGNGKESPWKINPNVGDYFYCVEMDVNNPTVFTGISAADGVTTVSFHIPSLYSFNYGQYHFVSLLSEIRTISNKTKPDGSVTALEDSTVNKIFGIKDELRSIANKHASKIYDTEEEWLIKDLLLWKGESIPESFDRDEQRYNDALTNTCGKCVLFIHEMPFNIISDSAYSNYDSNKDCTRETAKAYLNRYHNFEYQRLFKLWGIKMIMGGHKHTCAITRPVYDAPLGYNPIDKRLYKNGSVVSKTADYITDCILDDAALETGVVSGMFSNAASFQPFTQVKPSEFTAYWAEHKLYCNEVYNNSSSSITVACMREGDTEVHSYTLAAGESITDIKDGAEQGNKPRVRIEVVNSYNSPSYVMCQATGFKNKSNSDLASAGDIPWELFYVRGDSIQEQCYPFYTVYEVDEDGEVTVMMYQIRGMYAEASASGSPAGYWNLVEIYKWADTLEGNRAHFVGTPQQDGALLAHLYNTGGTIIDL